VLLKVLDHAVGQGGVDLARAVDAADAGQEHRPAAFGGAGARGRGLWRAEDGVGGGGDEVGFHQGLELRVWVAGAQGGDAAVEPGRGVGLLVFGSRGLVYLGGMWRRRVVVVLLRGGFGTYRCVVWFGPAGGFYAAVFVVVFVGLAARAASCCWRR